MISSASIYIPRISTIWSENDIKRIMTDNGFGTVSHIDFTPINKKPGFTENYNSDFMSAFVHFDEPILCANGKYIWMSGAQLGEFWKTIEQEQPYKLQVYDDEYWICLKNKNPIKRTIMNIHQVVENGRYLESLVMRQAEEISRLSQMVALLSDKFDTLLEFDTNCFIDTKSDNSSPPL